jgi:hypothetical protein
MCIYRDAHAYILAHIFMMFQMVFFLEACEKDVVFAGNGGGVW